MRHNSVDCGAKKSAVWIGEPKWVETKGETKDVQEVLIDGHRVSSAAVGRLRVRLEVDLHERARQRERER